MLYRTTKSYNYPCMVNVSQLTCGSLYSSITSSVLRLFIVNGLMRRSSSALNLSFACPVANAPYYVPVKSIITQRRIKKLVTTFCSDLEIKLVFTPFKIRSWFGAKDPFPAGLRSRVIYTTSFHVQAVMPVISVKPIDMTLRHSHP